ncbi:unnamed protein product [Notodromas monacha]|uniref:Cell cycle control protein n=1 Tax=Notodromas monacha TaxID=399045 RepID=A0A7R9C2A6_9CRUS|nr:unnamed protein product [Notodromas monacha]CAG0924789.1 unnamed protein product [Notodromas monacha]
MRAGMERSMRRPPRHAVFQQRMPSWKPIMNAGTVIPLFFAVSFIFLAFGSIIALFNSKVKTFELDYTDCERYAKSFDATQLSGTIKNQVTEDCYPMDYLLVDKRRTPMMPCGMIANSMFNDTYEIFYSNSSILYREDSADENETRIPIPIRRTQIAWEIDKKRRFGNPRGFHLNHAEAFNRTVRPVSWRKSVYELDPENPGNNGLQNEPLMIWMRPAAFSTFKKIYGRIDPWTNSSSYRAIGRIINDIFTALLSLGSHRHPIVLPPGVYTIKIGYNYPATSWRKSVSVVSTSYFGGKMGFLCIGYFVTGVMISGRGNMREDEDSRDAGGLHMGLSKTHNQVTEGGKAEN